LFLILKKRINGNDKNLNEKISGMKENNTMFWSDRLAKLMIERKKWNYLDKPMKKSEIFGIKSSTSISGVPHIGNASDVIRHDAVVRSLEKMGEKVYFIWVSEDMDPLRKVPAGIPKEFSKYLGMPVSSLPCPEGCCDSYVDHFDNLFIDSLRDYFGTNPELISTTKEYKKGEFYPYVKKVFENLDLVKQILNKNRTTPLAENWSPWKPVCENCGKIITTKVTGMDGDNVSYECQDYSFGKFGQEAYTRLEGCEHKGDSDIKKGDGKLLWKLEWAAEWPLWKIQLEGAGKEHFMPGASFWVAGEICEKVFNWPEPHPGKNEIQPYEYIMVGKQKMSASIGNVVATWDWPKFAPPEILRVILLKRPNRQRGFLYEKIPEMVDEFDKLKEIFYDHEKIEDEKELRNMKRLYESCVIEKEDHYIPNVSFSFLSLISQIIPDSKNNFDKVCELLQKTGHLKEINDEIKQKILERLTRAQEWMKRYGPEDAKVELLEKVPKNITEQLSEEQKQSLQELSQVIQKDQTEKKIWEQMKLIAEKNGIKPIDIFQAAYLVLLGKTKGPRLIPFIQVLDRNFVVKRFKLEK